MLTKKRKRERKRPNLRDKKNVKLRERLKNKRRNGKPRLKVLRLKFHPRKKSLLRKSLKPYSSLLVNLMLRLRLLLKPLLLLQPHNNNNLLTPWACLLV